MINLTIDRRIYIYPKSTVHHPSNTACQKPLSMEHKTNVIEKQDSYLQKYVTIDNRYGYLRLLHYYSHNDRTLISYYPLMITVHHCGVKKFCYCFTEGPKLELRRERERWHRANKVNATTAMYTQPTLPKTRKYPLISALLSTYSSLYSNPLPSL